MGKILNSTSASHRLRIITTSLIIVLIRSPSTIKANNNYHHRHHKQWSWAGPACQSSIAGCAVEGEMEMDSDINRRMLATTNHISYDLLQRNNVPCSQRGLSYYNCQPGAVANPYSRGCSAITRCRS